MAVPTAVIDQTAGEVREAISGQSFECADDVASDEDGHFITTAFGDLGEVAKNLESAIGEAETVKAIWKPKTSTGLDEDKAESLMKLVATLEDDDDVQEVYSNFEVSDAVMEKLTAA